MFMVNLSRTLDISSTTLSYQIFCLLMAPYFVWVIGITFVTWMIRWRGGILESQIVVSGGLVEFLIWGILWIWVIMAHASPELINKKGLDILKNVWIKLQSMRSEKTHSLMRK